MDHGHFEWLIMPFRLCNAPSTFQAMTKCLSAISTTRRVMASKPKEDCRESINGQAIVEKYVALRVELNQICLKVGELKIRASKHKQVINVIRLLDPSRGCYRTIEGLLVSTTIKEVLSSFQKDEEVLEVIIAELHEAFQNRKKEIAELEFKIAMDSSYQEEHQRFEKLFELGMASDVVRATDELNKIKEQKKVFLDLRRNIQDSREKSAASNTLGIADTQHIVMDIGLGIQMQLTLSEALPIMSKIEAMLVRQIIEYNQLTHFIKAHTKPDFPYFSSHGSFKYMKLLRYCKTEEGYLELDNELHLDEGHEVDDTFAEHKDDRADTNLDKFVFGKRSGKMNREARPSISHAFKGIHIRRHLSFHKELSCAKNASQAFVSSDSYNQNISNKITMENAGESNSSKPCTCKKSRCLQRYCKCFATGKHCKESCSCLHCLNKPLHEDIIQSRRKQIESGNSLALAQDRQGCNCRKSNCLNKYCECCKVDVGCSISCGCVDCENPFGRRESEFTSQ